MQRLVKLLPPGVERQMAYTGERMDAPRALAVGSSMRCSGTRKRYWPTPCKCIAAKSPLAVAGSKLAPNHARDHRTAASIA